MTIRRLEKAAFAGKRFTVRCMTKGYYDVCAAENGFHIQNEFEIIGFDLYAYPNEDPERHSIRIEMGKKLG